MPLPVIPGVFRVTLNWNRNDGIEPRNVFHVEAGDPQPTEEQMGADIASSLEHDMFAGVCPSFHFDTLTVLALNGTNAGIDVPVGSEGTGTGSTGNCVPASALILSMRTGLRGPSHRGRLYLGPNSEPDINAGLWDGVTTRTDIINAWTQFQTNLDGLSYVAGVCVASYTHGTAQGVTSFQIPQVLGTQRRRQDQLL